MKMTMFSKYARRACTVAMCCTALATAPMLAQSKGRARIMSPEQQQTQLNALTNAVGLTSVQVTQVQAINAHAMSQTLDIRNSGDDPATTGSKIKAIQRMQRTNIKALLTDEQKPKYDAYLATQRDVPGRGSSSAPPHDYSLR
jgi:periplasmic protein CpxP/Spy